MSIISFYVNTDKVRESQRSKRHIYILFSIAGDRGSTVVKVLWKVAGSITVGVIGIFY